MKSNPLLPVLAAWLATFWFSPARAQPKGGSPSERTDAYIRIMLAKKHIPGLSVAVLKEGHLLKLQSYGLSNLETGTPATAQTVYKIGSLSKQFIAAAVLLLEQRGKIALDSPITRYLDSLPAGWQAITIRHLLSHTSGLVRDPPDFNPLQVRPLSDDLKSIYSLPLDFAPGTEWDYSNMNYYVLAAIIEKVTDTSWAGWIDKHIFEPSGMRSTRVYSASDLVPNRASGYTATGTSWKNAEIWLAALPSGAFVSNTIDLAKWDRMLYTDQILTAASKRQLWTATKLSNGKLTHYGLGWFIDSVNGHPRIHHSGYVPGFKSDFERYPDEMLSVIVLANTDGANPDHLAQNIASFYESALRAQALPDTEPGITLIVNHFIKGLQQQSAIDTSTLSTDFVKGYNQNTARRLADAIRGNIHSLYLIQRWERNGRRTYIYRLDYGYDYIDLLLQFDHSGKIAGFGIAG